MHQDKKRYKVTRMGKLPKFVRMILVKILQNEFAIFFEHGKLSSPFLLIKDKPMLYLSMRKTLFPIFIFNKTLVFENNIGKVQKKMSYTHNATAFETLFKANCVLPAVS